MLVAVLCIALIVPFISGAAGKKPYKYYRPQPSKKVVLPPRASGKSDWCKKHPGKCAQKETAVSATAVVDTMCEYCIDDKGNRDGMVSPWEKQEFEPACMQMYDN